MTVAGAARLLAHEHQPGPRGSQAGHRRSAARHVHQLPRAPRGDDFTTATAPPVLTPEVGTVHEMAATEELDGRHARRAANRQAVLDALLDLYREGHFHPNTTEIAARAGVSQRSLFRYFEDVRALNRALLEQLLEEAAPYFDPGVPPSERTSVKAARLATVRVEQYEIVAPGAQAARARSHRNPGAAAQLASGRRTWRDQLGGLFAPELAAMDDVRAGRTLTAAEVLVSFESYDQLATGQGMTPSEIASVFEHGLVALFGRGSPRRR